jgi:alanyl-tRNA synthetase
MFIKIIKALCAIQCIVNYKNETRVLMLMNAKELKELFLRFYESKNHKRISSASLIPENDPSVLFTTAGMHPLVPFLLGHPHPLGRRLCNVQICIRTGDIDEVGDSSHLTFFEMLGNWSLGDYFKEEAITWSYEFLTGQEWLNLPIEKLAFTCFKGDSNARRDDEAANIWRKLGVRENRIAFLPKEDNWWGPAGEIGPCGPDTEMFYWTGNDDVPEIFNPKDSRWVEIWNDVFMQYNKNIDGTFIPLAQKNVDTGLGVERVAMILQGKRNVYETESFIPLIKKIKELTGVQGHIYEEKTKSIRIIADHIRAATFILGDHRGVVPSNMDQGYILRRFIRRIVRHLRLLGANFDEPLTPKLAEIVIQLQGEEYSQIKEKKEHIFKELKAEENKFKETLDKGIKVFEKLIEEKSKLTKEDAFLLFQSYGFPIEMIVELSEEKKITVDVEGFHEEFKKHQELSRAGAEKKFKGGLSDSSEMTTKLHTATHLLNEALRRVLGNDVKQKGSNITPERLRFDFNFDRKLTTEEIESIEKTINNVIGANLDIIREEMKYEDAKKSGAQAEFGAKYPEIVSVYSVADFSREICGGPHVKNTRELGTFKIIKEESSAQGIRRIKAVLI